MGSETKAKQVSGPVEAMRTGAVCLGLAVFFPLAAYIGYLSDNAVVQAIGGIFGILFYLGSFFLICLGIVLLVSGAAVMIFRWAKSRNGGGDA